MLEPVLTDDPRGELQVELHRLQLRFADTRVREPRAIEHLTRSIESCGQLVPCIAVRELEAVEAVSEDGAPQAIPGWVLIDGYRRSSVAPGGLRSCARAAVELRTDSAKVQHVAFSGNLRGFRDVVRLHATPRDEVAGG